MMPECIWAPCRRREPPETEYLDFDHQDES
jgi:hypothetical protein